MLQFFGYISGLLSIIMVVPYIWDIFKKTTKPERASWLIWTVLMSIAFFSQLAKGATNSLWLTGGQCLAVLSVFLLSIKYGAGGLTKRDVKALIAAGMGLIIWFITKDAIYSLIIVIIIDAIGVYLTIIKAYKEPESETVSTWFISGTASIFGMLAVGSLNFVLLLYPLYLFLANYAVIVAIFLGRKVKKNLIKQI
jgi:hypothetical protein